MKIKDKEFIREIISSDLKHISNPDFNRVTLEKIAELEESKVSVSNSGDITILIPLVIYVSMFILLSLIIDIIHLSHSDHINNFIHSINMISNFLVDPVMISILFSFILLYLIDLYLNKASTYFPKPKVV
jgi:hypothetical protein